MVLFGTVSLSVQVMASYPRYSSDVALFIHCYLMVQYLKVNAMSIQNGITNVLLKPSL